MDRQKLAEIGALLEAKDTQIEQLQAQVEKCREALEYYKDCLVERFDKNSDPCGGGHFDSGKYAIEALETIEKNSTKLK